MLSLVEREIILHDTQGKEKQTVPRESVSLRSCTS